MKTKIGILKLIPTGYADISIGDLCNHGNNGYCKIKDQEHAIFAARNGYEPIQPIVISDDEIKVGDTIYNSLLEKIETIDELWLALEKTVSSPKGSKTKVLVLPNQIPLDFIKAIVDGKFKDGDKVDVEVEYKGRYLYKKENDISNWNIKFNNDNTAIITPHEIDPRQLALEWIQENIKGRTNLTARDLAQAFQAGYRAK